MTRSPSRSAWTRALDFIGSVPFGVVTLILILAYCWVGSAGLFPIPNSFVRQMVEKTEMEWFSWWPFNLLIALLCVSVVTITLRRIPLNLPKLGVWTVHIGLVTLCIGCFVYFGTKVEGDVAVFRRELLLELPGVEPRGMLLQPGAQTMIGAGDTFYRVQVGEINPAYELLTGEDKGKKTASVQLLIDPTRAGQPQPQFIRQLLVDYPQYTEDVIPGQGRAIKVLGRRLIDERLETNLRYHGADRFFVHHTMAIHTRQPGQQQWAEYVVDDPPHYNEHVGSTDSVWQDPGERAFPARPFIEQGVLAEGMTAPVPGLAVKVIGYVPFALPDERWVPGGDEFFPMARISVDVGSTHSAHTLLALDDQQSRVSLGGGVLDATFRWIDDRAELQRALAPGPPTLVVRIPSRGVTREIPLAEAMDHPVAIAGTEYTIQGLEIYPRWSLAGGERAGTPSSMVLVKVDKPGGGFTRAVVSPQAELSQDLDQSGHRMQGLLDEAIRIEARNISDVGLVVIAGAQGMHALLISRGAEVMHQQLQLGVPASFFDGSLRVSLDEVSRTAQRDTRPHLIARRERDLRQLPFYSMVQVELTEAGAPPLTVWLPYSNFNYPTRTGYSPQRVRLPSGRELDLLYSRRTHALPAPVALEVFELETYPGGTRERDYRSLVRFFENGRWSETHQVHSNNPTEHAGWWYFQSTWDPPDEQSGNNGMNFTGLGVGNRHGVGVMLLGCVLMSLGTIWAFYVKPVILRRLAERGATRRTTVPSQSADHRDGSEQPAAAGSVGNA